MKTYGKIYSFSIPFYILTFIKVSIIYFVICNGDNVEIKACTRAITKQLNSLLITIIKAVTTWGEYNFITNTVISS
ncbi:MAG TPA: hypothetical protein VF677_10850 [Flavobacterium sp.]|jgi:hypothetical protein